MKLHITPIALFLAALPVAYAGGAEPHKAVWRAALNGEAALSALLATGVSVNTADWDGETALMEAADKGQAEAVKLLLKHGADVNAADKEGGTALMEAVKERRFEAARLLREAGATR